MDECRLSRLSCDLLNSADGHSESCPALRYVTAHVARALAAPDAGGGVRDPIRAICSSLFAAKFQPISYPVLPVVSLGEDADTATQREVLNIRHHSLFAPRDFHLSQNFEMIKPMLIPNFHFHKLIRDKSPGSDRSLSIGNMCCDQVGEICDLLQRATPEAGKGQRLSR